VTEPSYLAGVRLRAQRRVLWCRELWARNHYADEQALAITHSEVERTLAPPGEILAQERAFYVAGEAVAPIGAELAAVERGPAEPRWRHLVELFELSEPEQALLACALATEAQPTLRRVFGYLQDDVAPLDGSPALVAALWCLEAAPVIGAQSPLRFWRLARPLGGHDPEASSTPWTADPLVLAYLRGEAAPGPLSHLVPISAEPVLFADELDQIAAFAQALATPVEVEIAAPAGAGKATLAAQAARQLGHELLAVDARAIAAHDDPAGAAIRELRQARLQGAVVLWRHAEVLPEAAAEAVRGRAPLTFLTSAKPLPEAGSPAAAVRRCHRLPALERGRRLALWDAIAPGRQAPGPVAEWALRAGEVVAAAQAAAAGEDAVREVCKRLLLDTPSKLVTALRLPYRWDDLVASAQLLAHLHELEAQARSRSEVLDGWGMARLVSIGRGVTAMFAGPSGTGKTMAAQVLARELGLELLRVDLAGVVNKYIGETEKHLQTVFAACERSPVMLFFDEADALFGKRMQVSDAHDRYANIEVDYLLQRMEEFDGVAVLATNRKGDIDTAFMRRLRFVIDFAPPTVEERERLWRLALERAADAEGEPLVGELDWPALARDLDLTGAGIKASALAAAFLARTDGTAIGAHHIIAAARRELEKQGIVVRAGAFDRTALEPAPPAANGSVEPPSVRELERMVTGGGR
jgi:hypothetical protein